MKILTEKKRNQMKTRKKIITIPLPTRYHCYHHHWSGEYGLKKKKKKKKSRTFCTDFT